MTGTIIKGVGGLYTVDCGGAVYTCNARGLFRLRKVTPLIGDLAEIEESGEAGMGVLRELLPRRNEMDRPRAANVDLCVVVCPAAEPAPNLELLDTLIINAASGGLAPVVCVTKTDLAADGFLEGTRRQYRAFGYAEVCAASGDLGGLRGLLAGKTALLAGVSGAGKSSLLNALTGREAMETGALSRKIERGRHTTRHAELIALGGGTFIIDTPGFSNVSVNADRRGLQGFYPEFAPFIGDCYYGDCLHISEHDCAVKAAVGAGVDLERYNRYVAICGKL